MSEISSAYSNYVRFRLTAVNVDSFILDSEPIGWKEDDLELDRHKDYHGIFTNFTNNLEFINEAKDYIDTAYKVGGINADLTLTKDVLVDNGDDVIFKTRYTAKADFNTMVKTATKLTIKFTSNNLTELIKSHESDEFEIETTKSIDDDVLDEIVLDKTEIKGRSLNVIGESVFDTENTSSEIVSTHNLTPITKLISDTQTRHSSVITSEFGDATNPTISAGNLFFDRSTNPGELDINIDVNYSLNFSISNAARFLTVKILLLDWNGSSYDTVEEEVIIFDDWAEPFASNSYNVSGTYNKILTKTQGLLFEFRIGGSYDGLKFDDNIKSNIKISEVEFFESSPNLDCIFSHDLSSRLMYIITGRKDAYYSKYFGRKELGYTEDGEGGLIALMSGYWIRAFDRSSEKYKSLKISLKDQIESNRTVFNTGIGVETVNNKERLREEDLKYFYQNEAVVKLPNQIKNEKRTVDTDLFFSGMTFGYDKVFDYENEIGLDEPNTRTEYVTPIRKSTKKYKRLSKVRADEYPAELARRKPQKTFPLEDTKYDDNNWFKDLKRTDFLGYEEKESVTNPTLPTNRLKEQASGINSPETFRSSFFTPLRMLMRHAWVFRSGMEVYLDKKIKYISKDKNSTLQTHATDDWNKALDKPYIENEDITVRDLERSRFLPEIVEFEHPVDDELMEWINGTTTMIINGSEEEVPNIYFKFEYTNENGILERGYLLNLKPNKEGKWKMQLSNENLIT